MHEGERPVLEQAEVALEFARGADAAFDFSGVRIPEIGGRLGQYLATPPVQLPPPGAGSRTEQLEELGVRELAVGGLAQLDAGKLRGRKIERDDARRAARKQREAVVAGRGDRHANIPGARRERVDQDVGVLPALRVADALEA